jgi:predicted CopG family antitoxin
MKSKKSSQYEENDKADGKNTTIAVSMKVREELAGYGLKGESYSEIIARLIKSAHERLLSDVLMDEKDCITIEEAIRSAKQRWQE